ncbi:MAG: SMC-Scp complex subunit ScpB [Candidatus Hadarchaeum sp.]|uniref:SMC-Scp complex subunit ScpB n=1 Tax=Candidatus Hadarchaeum sp. TaxID=2883567 RepID=UPI003D1099F5
MGIKQDRATIEAALYAADRPLTLAEIKKLVGTSSETYVRKIIEDLKREYSKKGGPLNLVETGKDTFTLRLNEEYIPKLEGVIPKIRLTRGAIKTLAMIAYNQNISQAKIAEIRGNRVYDHIRQLVSLGFVESRPFGRTRMLRTTKKFASYFGFEDDMDKIREEIQNRLR